MKSLQTRISISTGIAVVASIGVLASITAYSAYQAAVTSASANTLADARFQGAAVKAEIEVALDTARAVAHMLAGAKTARNPQPLTREQVIAMLEETTRRNPAFLAAYTAWEPGAFDGNDAKYAGTKGHDKTGRFLPYVVRNPSAGHNSGYHGVKRFALADFHPSLALPVTYKRFRLTHRLGYRTLLDSALRRGPAVKAHNFFGGISLAFTI